MPVFEYFLPQHPMKGPPLPQIWGVKWPGKSGNPVLYDTETKIWTEEKRTELLEKGYPKSVVEAGLTWANSWASGMVRFFGVRGAEAESLFKGAYKIALSAIEDWYAGIKGALRYS